MTSTHNEVIASPDNGGLLGVIHANTNDGTISDTMLRYIAPPKLHPIIDHRNMLCGCAICNTSKYFQ